MAESRCFAFVFGMASGHINPSLPLARRLVSEGHQVHYLSREQMRTAIEDTGATFWNELEEETELYEGRETEIMGANSALKKELGIESEPMIVGWMKVAPWTLELQLPGCIRWLNKIDPSTVVYCPLLNQDAGYAAHILQIPSVALLTTAGPGSLAAAMDLFMAGQKPEDVIEILQNDGPVHQHIRNLKAKYGLDYDIYAGLRTLGYFAVLTKADLVLMTTTEDLQDSVPPELLNKYQKAGVQFVGVGPLLDQQGAKRAAGHKFEEGTSHGSTPSDVLQQVKEAKKAGRSVIYASMGTVVTGDSPDFGWAVKPDGPDGRKGLTGKQLCQSAFGALFDAFGDQSGPASSPFIVLATGPQPDALENLEVPKNALCVAEVPQVDLLRSGVDLFLTHFGQNSFMESLSTGVPMVGCPGCVDQPANAKKAQAMGIALQVDRPVPEDGEELHAMQEYRKEVSEALKRVFEEPHFKNRVEEISRSIKEAGGVPRATEMVLGVAGMKRPTLLTGGSKMEIESPEKPLAAVAVA